MVGMAFLVELDHTAADGSDARTERWSDTAVRPFAETDPDRPGAEWDERLIDPPTVTQEIGIDPTRDGGQTYGALALSNADGALAGLYGRKLVEVRCYYGPAEATAFSAFRLWLHGRPTLPERSVSAARPGRLLIGVYSLLLDLQDEIHTDRYTGANVGSAGYEGSSEDKDRVKPLAWGDLTGAHVPAALANAVARVAQTSALGHDGAVTVFSGGGNANLTWLTPQTGALFDAATPSATQGIEDRPRGLVRIGGSLTGAWTLGFRASAAASCGAAAVIRALLTRRGSGTIGATLTAPPAGADPTVGLWLPDAATYATTLQSLTRSIGGWLLPDTAGTWQLGLLSDPAAGTPAVEWTADDVVAVEPDDRELTRPVWEVTVRWGRLFKTFTRSDLAQSLWDTDEEKRLGQQWREVVRSAPATKTVYGTDARKLTVETQLRTEGAAIALAERLLACLGTRADGKPRESWSVTVEATDAHLALGLGGVARFGFSPHITAANFLIRRVRPAQPRRSLITFGLWG